MPMERLIIQNEAHKAELGQSLVQSRASGLHSDVILHCGSGRTHTCHRLVLASMSDWLRDLLALTDPESEVHISLPEMEPAVLEIVAQFTYEGTVKIPKTLVEKVCEAAHRLKIKFLKDSFVKINQKDFQAIKDGRKTLKPLSSPPLNTSPAASPVKLAKPVTKMVKSPPKGLNLPTKGTDKNNSAGSDTDSAESDEENNSNPTKPPGIESTNELGTSPKAAKIANNNRRRIKTQAGKDVKSPTGKPPTAAQPPPNIMFTLTKQLEDDKTNAISEAGHLLVHFQKDSNAENKNPVKLNPASPNLQKRVILTTTAGPTLPNLPPGVTLPTRPAISLPTAPVPLANVKKVVIPPMVRGKLGSTAAKFVVTTSTPQSPPSITRGVSSMVTLGGSGGGKMPIQVQTVRQPDGREIRVICKTPGTTFLKTTMANTSSSVRTVPGSGPALSKDVLARAMQAITSTASAMPGMKGLSPNAPVIRMVSPSKAMGPKPTQIALQPKPSSTSAKVVANKTVTKTVLPTRNPTLGAPAPISTQSKADRLSVSAPKPGIPATVPDDFLEDPNEEKSSSDSKGSIKTGSDKKGANKNNKRGATNTHLKSKTTSNTEAVKSKTLSANKSKTSQKPVPEIDPNVRSSGRARKINPKYKNDDDDDEEESESNSSILTPPRPSNPKSIPGAVKKANVSSAVSAPNVKKRKLETTEEEADESKGEAEDPENGPSPPKQARSRRSGAPPPESPAPAIKKESGSPKSTATTTKSASTNASGRNKRSATATPTPKPTSAPATRRVPSRSAKSDSTLPEKRVRKQRIL
ncbi:mucin-5AC-like [Tigriopus californicus]|nr:mucin-5AC-like [Tigriopus californicus]|eukprot:TCALIF_11038-PA protein Name:"Protein of unknown function" AED:0.00 eAED:0.00 QI:120/1/1/1/1/1/2/119/805